MKEIPWGTEYHGWDIGGIGRESWIRLVIKTLVFLGLSALLYFLLNSAVLETMIFSLVAPQSELPTSALVVEMGIGLWGMFSLAGIVLLLLFFGLHVAVEWAAHIISYRWIHRNPEPNLWLK